MNSKYLKKLLSSKVDGEGNNQRRPLITDGLPVLLFNDIENRPACDRPLVVRRFETCFLLKTGPCDKVNVETIFSLTFSNQTFNSPI